jgi:hypothetical protein
METNSNSNKVTPLPNPGFSAGIQTFRAKKEFNPMLLGLMANVKEKKVDTSGKMRIKH